jgi:hypothetical protein
VHEVQTHMGCYTLLPVVCGRTLTLEVRYTPGGLLQLAACLFN